MLQVGKNLVSLDIVEKKFICELASCKGACCVLGDSGAPLEEQELMEIEASYTYVKPYLREESIKAIEKDGLWYVDSEGDKVTTLVNQQECAFVVFEEGKAVCAIEKAYNKGEIGFKKPISCHLYPIRITSYSNFDAINYHEWDICKQALKVGSKLGIPVYVFLKEALIRKYGEDWYLELEHASREYLKYISQK